jgi:hypothetical protein
MAKQIEGARVTFTNGHLGKLAIGYVINDGIVIVSPASERSVGAYATTLTHARIHHQVLAARDVGLIESVVAPAHRSSPRHRAGLAGAKTQAVKASFRNIREIIS